MQIVEENTTAVILIDAPAHLDLAQETITVTMTEGVTLIDGALQGQIGPQGVQGEKGDPGEGGIGGTINRTAATILSGHRVIATDVNGEAIYADKDTPSHVGKVLGICTHAAIAGATIVIQAFGEFTEPTWNWTAGSPIYLGANGTLTQTPPTTGFLLEVAFALTSTSIFISIKQPFVRS